MIKKFVISFIFLFTITNAAALEILFYTDSSLSNNLLANPKYTSTQILQHIKSHAKQINIIAPQIYGVDKNGVVWGSIDPNIVKLAKNSQLKLMPLVVNPDFDQKKLHELLTNSAARDRILNELINLAKRYNYYGFQFDFENVNINDKNEYTAFIKKASEALHKNNLAISITTLPHIKNAPINNAYRKWYYTNWSGAFDYPQLAKYCDFITVMMYDLHTSFTTPGPIAPLPWVEKFIKYLITIMPADKISLVVPVYSGLWQTKAYGGAFKSHETQISYQDVQAFLQKYKLKPHWDKTSQAPFVIYSDDGTKLNKFLFIENAKTFADKLNLAEKYNLRGISVWKLGYEDPKVWKKLANN